MESDDTIIVGFGDKDAVVVDGFVVAGRDAAGVGELAGEVDIGQEVGEEGFGDFCADVPA